MSGINISSIGIDVLDEKVLFFLWLCHNHTIFLCFWATISDEYAH